MCVVKLRMYVFCFFFASIRSRKRIHVTSARDASSICYNSFNGNTRNVCVAKKRFLEIRPRTHSPSRGHFRLAENAGLKDFPARSAPPRRLIFSHQEALKQKMLHLLSKNNNLQAGRFASNNNLLRSLSGNGSPSVNKKRSRAVFSPAYVF